MAAHYHPCLLYPRPFPCYLQRQDHKKTMLKTGCATGGEFFREKQRGLSNETKLAILLGNRTCSK